MLSFISILSTIQKCISVNSPQDAKVREMTCNNISCSIMLLWVLNALLLSAIIGAGIGITLYLLEYGIPVFMALGFIVITLLFLIWWCALLLRKSIKAIVNPNSNNGCEEKNSSGYNIIGSFMDGLNTKS